MRIDRTSTILFSLLLFSGVGALHKWSNRDIEHEPGITIEAIPVQDSARDSASWMVKEYRLFPLAEYEIKARVLSSRRYRWGRQADISPLDLALGWRTMSDTDVLRHLDLWQNDRWFRYTTRERSLPFNEMSREAANVHLIPASPEIRRQLISVRRGELLELRGRLVKAEHPDGWRWTSSLRRDDQGNGACELMWVESVRILPAEDVL